MRRYLFLFLIASLALSSCEGARNNTSWSHKEEGAEIVPSVKKATHPAAAVDSTAAGAGAADTTQEKH
jgi:hypothetical protein